MSIIVFGSLNLDLVAKTPQIPHLGETVHGTKFFTASGGKGANQAVAAAKLGMTTYIIGRVGNDPFAPILLKSLTEAGVNTEGIQTDYQVSSGVAMIAVDSQGNNQIIIIGGANQQVNLSDGERLKPLLSKAKCLLLQLEIPLDAVIAAAEMAKTAGLTVILDPAPAPDALPLELYQSVDIITPNETETAKLVGFELTNETTYHRAADILLKRGVKTVIITLGEKGVFWATDAEREFVPSYQVKAIDTVAAGDGFNGALAVALAKELSLKEAIQWGIVAGALTTTVEGAQPALPDAKALETAFTLLRKGNLT